METELGDKTRPLCDIDARKLKSCAKQQVAPALSSSLALG